jgi:FkbM family methyltransferase
MKPKSVKSVIDNQLGELIFPAGDNVMAPTIHLDGTWEENEIDWLKKNVSPGDHCINVGANVGYFSIWLGKLVGENGSVTAFEPNPNLIPFFIANIQNSKLKNIKLRHAAVGNRSGFQWLFLNEKNFGDSRMFDPRITSGGGNYRDHGFHKIPRRRLVRIVKLDKVINENIDIVLIDAQGYDHEVLRGMKRIIANFRPKILTEFVPQWLSDIGEDPLKVLDEYKSWGYSIGSTDFDIPPDSTSQDILSALYAGGLWYTNLILF